MKLPSEKSILSYFSFYLISLAILTALLSLSLILIEVYTKKNKETVFNNWKDALDTETKEYVVQKVSKTISLINRYSSEYNNDSDSLPEKVLNKLQETINLYEGLKDKTRFYNPVWIDSINGKMLLNNDTCKIGKYINDNSQIRQIMLNIEMKIAKDGGFFKYINEDGKEKISYVKLYKKFGWFVGCGQNIINNDRQYVEKLSKSEIFERNIIIILISVLFLFFLVFSFLIYLHFNRAIHKDIELFKKFFKENQQDLNKISIDLIKLEDFKPIAKYANEMLEKQIQSKEYEKLSIVASESYNAVIIMNALGEVEWINNGFSKLFGLNKEDLYKLYKGNFFKSPFIENNQKSLSLCLSDKIPIVYETYFKNINNVEYLIQTTLTPIIKNDIIRFFVAIITDQTELDKTRKMLIESKKLEQLGYVVRGISHEIGTPIVLGTITAETIINEINKLDSLFKKEMLTYSDLDNAIKIIKDQSDRIVRNMKNAGDLLKSYHNIAKDELKGEKRLFNLEEKIKDIIISIDPRIQQQNVKIYYETDNIEVNSYPGAISQILINLILNSLKHGFVNRNDGSIYIKSYSTEKELIIFYSDNGVGIPEDECLHIFDIFFTTKPKDSSGLGLSIVKRLIENIGGTIVCKSEINIGTSFNISIQL